MTAVGIDPRFKERRVAVLRGEGRRRLRILVGCCVLVALVVGGLWLLRSPLFSVDEVAISGAEQTSLDDVLAAAAIEPGEPLVDLDLDQSRAAIAELPWVDQVVSDRVWPGEVHFTITEREPVAAILGASDWMIVDGSGRVLEVVDQVPQGLTVIHGPGWSTLPGGWISESAVGAIEVAALLPRGLASSVALIELRDGTIELGLFGGGVVQLGSSADADEKFLAALSILRGVDLDCLDRVDVRIPSAPVLTRVPDCP